MRNTVLAFELMAGTILAAMMLLTSPFMERIGLDKAEFIDCRTMVLAFLMVFFGVKSYRENVAAGTLTFGRAFVVGLLSTLLSAGAVRRKPRSVV